jgi:hypothetical protein
MKMLAQVAVAAFLLFGVNTHARADGVCMTLGDLVAKMQNDALTLHKTADITGDQVAGIVKQFNAIPPEGHDDADRIVVITPRKKENGQGLNVAAIVLVKGACVSNFGVYPTEKIAQIIGQGS